MVNYPSQLTSEEKSLRKRYARLQEKTKELKDLQSAAAASPSGHGGSSSEPIVQVKGSKSSGASQTKDPPANPKDAREAAKKLLEAGKLSIVNKRAQMKTTGFKRVGEGANKGSNIGNPLSGGLKRSSMGRTASGTGSQAPPPFKPKPVVRPAEVKQLYSRFVKASDSIKDQKIPKFSSDNHQSSSDDIIQPPAEHQSMEKSTIYITWRDVVLNDEALREALSRFGSIRDIKLRGQGEAFVTFQNPDIARTVKNEMDRGMIHGSEVLVEQASKENGYVELPPDVVDEPWARISAGIDQFEEKSQPRASRKRPVSSRTIVKYDEPNF